MKSLKIGVPIAAQQKGFLVSLAIELDRRGHKTFFIARHENAEKVIRELYPEKSNEYVDLRPSTSKLICESVIDECLNREKKYGVTFAMLASQDRALGKGYLFNADVHPDVIRSWWSKEKKYKEILNEFLYYEYIMKKFSPDLIVGYGQWKILRIVCEGHDVKYLSLSTPRYKSKYIWVENLYDQNYKFISAIGRHVKSLTREPEFSETELVQTEFAKYFFKMAQYTYGAALKRMFSKILTETYQKMRGTFKKDSYRFMGWNRYILQIPYNYSFFLRNGKTIEGLKESRIVLYPLQFEPESSLLDLSPELNNSMELISWISKSLPSDATLVVKEHPACFGARSTWYYNNFRRMSNVVLAHPAISSMEWLKHCQVVVTITGTMGFEAVFMEKPVVSFGKYQHINELPTVRYANSFQTTQVAVNELMCLDKYDIRLKISKEALNRAFEEITFDLSGFERTFTSVKLNMDLAGIAIENLLKIYPEAF